MPVEVVPSPEIGARCQFSRLCNVRGLMSAVEVGTDRGYFARRFLEGWDGHTLVCVDSYHPYSEMPWPRDMDKMMAVHQLAPHHGRVRFWPLNSEASAEHARSLGYSPGFVFIDGAHDYDSVRADLEAWWPRVAPGGILAGHDWTDGADGPAGDVQRAVLDFAEAEGVATVYYTTRDVGTNPSWYTYKPGDVPFQAVVCG